jgi:cbb3-type cytochrome oxidase maturation protein
MESLYILVPLSVLLILAMIGLFAWALQRGQFDDIGLEGERLLQADEDGQPAKAALDTDQALKSQSPEQSR